MAGSIMPLPVMLEEEDQKVYDALEAPKSMVLRYGYQKRIAELRYEGDAKPGCGSKLVIRTNRGTEMAEMLTTTCPNSGCGSAVSRKDMLKYIQNSGGKDYPFTNEGKVLRVATVEDLNEQTRLDGNRVPYLRSCKAHVERLKLKMRMVDVEILLGGERILFYYQSEDWVDFRELVKDLAAELQTRIEMTQVSDREEARLVADYEKCGQRCCCKQFLKVLKPVSMRSAKVQKATLDPKKISGRCGRLMCCLRYEDKTYSDLKKTLPHRKSLVETEDGIGMVLDTQILTQLALVKIGMGPPQAYPVENIRVLGKDESKAFMEEQRQREEEMAAGRLAREQRRPRKVPPHERQASGEAGASTPSGTASGSAARAADAPAGGGGGGGGGAKKKRRRRRGQSGAGEAGGTGGQAGASGASGGGGAGAGTTGNTPGEGGQGGAGQGGAVEGGGGSKKKRRRRRRPRKPGGGDAGQGGSGGGRPSDSGGG